MLFNSPIFLAFALVFFGLWYALPRQGQRLRLLVGASFVFYGYWDWRFVFLLLASGLVDFYAARAIHRRREQARWFLGLSIACNLGILGTFKYLGFFTELVAGLAAQIGLQLTVPEGIAGLVLPVGISFYTFQSMSYTIDVYRRQLAPTDSLCHFFAYLSMFTQLVAGPIERAAHILPQLERKRTPSPEQCWEGWRLLVIGFFKKALIADNLAPFVNEAFANPEAQHGLVWTFAIPMFAMQIYCDFSGYTDIARGLARLMGIDLMKNFNRPYAALGLRDFWARWHISLSTWFRDYVYIPLGGSRRSELRTHLALWITLLLSGLWHGAGTLFVAWGAYHALLLSFERLLPWPAMLARLGRGGRYLGQALTVFLVLLSWVLFRAEEPAHVLLILDRMPWNVAWSWPFAGLSYALCAFVIGLGAFLLSFVFSERDALPIPAWLEWIALPVMLVLTVFFRGPGSNFIYFQF